MVMRVSEEEEQVTYLVASTELHTLRVRKDKFMKLADKYRINANGDSSVYSNKIKCFVQTRVKPDYENSITQEEWDDSISSLTGCIIRLFPFA